MTCNIENNSLFVNKFQQASYFKMKSADFAQSFAQELTTIIIFCWFLHSHGHLLGDLPATRWIYIYILEANGECVCVHTPQWANSNDRCSPTMELVLLVSARWALPQTSSYARCIQMQPSAAKVLRKGVCARRLQYYSLHSCVVSRGAKCHFDFHGLLLTFSVSLCLIFCAPNVAEHKSQSLLVGAFYLQNFYIRWKFGI